MKTPDKFGKNGFFTGKTGIQLVRKKIKESEKGKLEKEHNSIN
jgi:hypothetical protein